MRLHLGVSELLLLSSLVENPGIRGFLSSQDNSGLRDYFPTPASPQRAAPFPVLVCILSPLEMTFLKGQMLPLTGWGTRKYLRAGYVLGAHGK